jgi:isopenicillin-N epimerase
MDANPMAFFTRGLTDRIAHTRRHLAGFLGADPDGTALVPNATAATQLVLNSLDLRPGDEVLLTDHGYGAVRLAVERLCARAGAVIREASVPLAADDDEVVAAITAAVGPRTRFAVIDQVTSHTAKLLPVSGIIAALHRHDVLVMVDAAHAPGMLPLNVGALGADFWLGNLHKWAFAPRPTGLLVVAPAHRASMEPLVVSWEYPAGFPGSVEYAGTLDYTAWLAAPTGLHLLRSLDVDRVRRHNADLAAYGQRTIAAALGVDRTGMPAAPIGMRLIPLPAGVVHDLPTALALRARIAAELSCEVPIVAWAPLGAARREGYLRVSAQIYNRAEDYDRLAATLPGLLATSRPVANRPRA